jgi:hypothetical protein
MRHRRRHGWPSTTPGHTDRVGLAQFVTNEHEVNAGYEEAPRPGAGRGAGRPSGGLEDAGPAEVCQVERVHFVHPELSVLDGTAGQGVTLVLRIGFEGAGGFRNH